MEICFKCKEKIKDFKTIGDKACCNACYNLHITSILNRLDELTNSKDFKNRQIIIKEIFKINEEMGNWMSSYKVSDIYDLMIETLQLEILQIQIDLMEDIGIDKRLIKLVKEDLDRTYFLWKLKGGKEELKRKFS